MAKQDRFVFQGLVPGKSACEVVFTEDVGGSRRVRSFDVPWDALATTHVLACIDREVRRHLIEVWSEVDIADPLF